MSVNQRRPTILIVDDAPEMIVVLGKILARYTVCAARSGEEGLELIEKRPFDLILLDMNMTGMSGLEFLEQLQHKHEARETPVLFVTADDDAEVESRALRAGAVDFIRKPVNPDVLLARVRTQLKVIEQRDALRDREKTLETAVQERTADLIEAQLAADAANRAKILFLGNMSHELRTPIHHLSAVGHSLGREALSDRGKSRLGTMKEAVKRLDGMVGRILDVVDLEAGSAAVSFVPLNLPDLLDQVVRSVMPSVTEKGLSLYPACEAGLSAPYKGDSGHIRTILGCYLDNAIRHTREGRIHVRLTHQDEDDAVATLRIEVQDDGPGVRPEHLLRIFDAFEQVDNSNARALGGAGVGLAIVKRLTTLMGGSAGCDSAPGHGATFWATVRLLKPDIPAPAPDLDFQI